MANYVQASKELAKHKKQTTMIKHIKITAADIEDTKGQFFGIEWTKQDGTLRVANAHVKDVSWLKPDRLVVYDRNAKHNITIDLNQVNYFAKGGERQGFSYMKGKRGQRIEAATL